MLIHMHRTGTEAGVSSKSKDGKPRPSRSLLLMVLLLLLYYRLRPADRRLHKEAAPPVCTPKRLPILLTWGVPGKRLSTSQVDRLSPFSKPVVKKTAFTDQNKTAEKCKKKPIKTATCTCNTQYTDGRLCTHTQKKGRLTSILDRTIKCPRQTTQDE